MSETHKDPQEIVENGNNTPVDHTGRRSTREEEEFTAKVDKIVAAEMPRMFAMCEEIDDGATILAWGLSFKNHAEMILAADGRQRHFLFPPQNTPLANSQRAANTAPYD
jgi:hypothetical protein